MSEASIFVQDDDCHWYVIPENQLDSWQTWIESADWDNVPEYAEEIDSPQNFPVFLKTDKLKALIEATTAWHQLKLHEHPPGSEAPVPAEWINTVGERCRALDKAIEDYLKP